MPVNERLWVLDTHGMEMVKVCYLSGANATCHLSSQGRLMSFLVLGARKVIDGAGEGICVQVTVLRNYCSEVLGLGC